MSPAERDRYTKITGLASGWAWLIQSLQFSFGSKIGLRESGARFEAALEDILGPFEVALCRCHWAKWK